MGFCDLVARATSRNREIVRDAGVSFHFVRYRSVWNVGNGKYVCTGIRGCNFCKVAYSDNVLLDLCSNISFVSFDSIFV